jgi:hypothetical protein
MKPTPAQQALLARIENGESVSDAYRELAPAAEAVLSFQWSRDGMSIVAHRTVRKTMTGNPRLDYRVEMFRLDRDGDINKL